MFLKFFRGICPKIISFLKRAVTIMIILSIFVIIGGFFLVYAYADFDREAQSTYLSKYTFITSNIYTDTTLNKDAITKIDNFYKSLPQNVCSALSQDWKIIISPNIPGNDIQHSDESPETTTVVLGCSNSHWRLIFIKEHPNPAELYRVFLHELGHCFDYEFGTPSSTDDFIAIYNQYKDTFEETDSHDISNYATSSPKEFFATVFKNYFLNPEHLKVTAPDAYSFFESLYSDISNDTNADTTLKYDLQSALLVIKNQFSQ